MDLIDILLAKRLVEKELPPAIINLKGVIPTHFELPLSGNAKGDVWVVSVDNSEWIWMSDNSSGTISDYEMMGVVFDLRPYRTAADQDVIDSGKQAKVTASGMLKGDGNGGVTSATAGTDYGTYSKPANGIPSSDFDSSTQALLLPAVTNVDNGKFARVVNGAWAAVTIPEAAGGDF